MLLDALTKTIAHLPGNVDQLSLTPVLQHFPLADLILHRIPAIREVGTLPERGTTEDSRRLTRVSRNGDVPIAHLPVKTAPSLIHRDVAVGLQGSKYFVPAKGRFLFLLQMKGQSSAD